ncbi:MAG: hypothetical protein ACREDR_11520, partial [Blastocatellia bacterium]
PHNNFRAFVFILIIPYPTGTIPYALICKLISAPALRCGLVTAGITIIRKATTIRLKAALRFVIPQLRWEFVR